MSETVFKVGDIVELRTTHTGAQHQFVVSEIANNYLTVVWFDKESKKFDTTTLIDKVFRKA